MSETIISPEEEFITKRKQPLWGTFSISLLIHAAVILTFGSVVVFKVFERPPAQFNPPPPPPKVTKIEPRKLQHRIKIREQQQNSGRPRVSPRLTANRVAGISLPEIDVETQTEKIRSKMQKTAGKNYSLAGLGTGLGSGTGSGGLGTGASNVSFFGLTGKGERIAFIIDLSRSMVEDDKGGLDGIKVLKAELTKMVQKLNDGTFFNLIFFDRAVDLFMPKLVVAKPSLKKEAAEFITPYYSEFGKNLLEQYANGNRSWPPATRLNNYTAPVLESAVKFVAENARTGGATNSQMDVPIVAAFEMKADTIFIISDGRPILERALFGKELDQFEKATALAEAQTEKMNGKDRQRLEEKYRQNAEKFWKDLDEENARRARRGLPPKVFEQGEPGLDITQRPNRPCLTPGQTVEYIRALAMEIYGDRKKLPRIYTVAYGAQPDGQAFLKDLAQDFKGQFKEIRGLAPPVKVQD